MEPTRLLLFENGAALGVFPFVGDGSDGDGRGGNGIPRQHSVVVMEPSGAAFTHVHQDGSCQRQLSDFCRRDLLPHVTALSTFRNAHSPRPYLSRRLHASADTTVSNAGGGVNRSNTALRASQHHGRRTSRLAQWPTAPPVGSLEAVAAAAAAGWGRAGAGVGVGRLVGRVEGVSEGKGGGQGLMKHCAVHADGAVEVRAASGNARLTLSASRTMVEVDYAATAAATAATVTDHCFDTPRAAARGMVRPALEKEEGEEEEEEADGFGRGGGGSGRREAQRRGCGARAAKDSGSRVWVNRRFLAGSSCSVPPEFAHALGVAHTVSSSLGSLVGEGRGVRGAGFGGVCKAGDWDGGGFVAAELPRPEERPDHARWDTVQTSPPYLHDNPHAAPWVGGTYGGGAGWSCFPTSSYSTANDNSVNGAGVAPALLAVDVMQLAEDRGFAGGLAAVVESSGECTYQVVLGADGGGGGGGVNVHVVVHADGTEVLLEGDFVRLVRPPSSTTATTRGPQERLLHVSAVTTFRFLVPCRIPQRPPGHRFSPASGSRTSRANRGKTYSAVVAAAAAAAGEEGGEREGEEGEGGAWRSVSLGDIAARALALRRQFAARSVAVAAAEAGPERRRGVIRSKGRTVKITPAVFGSWSGLAVAEGAANAAQAALNSTPTTPASKTATTMTATPMTATTAAITDTPASTATPTTPADRRWRQKRRDSPPFDAPTTAAAAAAAAAAAKGAERKTHEFSAAVVERAEHGGASFVAFADGRTRGAFADRTIVNLGAPAPTRHSRPPRRRWEGRPVGGGRAGTGGASVGAAPSPSYPGIGFPLAGVFSETGVEEGGDREIECVRPDGTVVRLSERSLALARRSRFGTSGSLGTGGLGKGEAGLARLPPPNAVTHATHVVGSAVSHPDTAAAAAATAARLHGGDADHPLDITPYVAAVRRFADWALAEPEERRARARRGADGKLAAAAEAERNRRFVELQSLMKPSPSRSAINHAAGQSSGRKKPVDRLLACSVEGRRGDGGARRARAGESGEDNKENVGSAGGPAGWGSKGACERNALVNRLLEANREVLIGREALRRIGR